MATSGEYWAQINVSRSCRTCKRVAHVDDHKTFQHFIQSKYYYTSRPPLLAEFGTKLPLPVGKRWLVWLTGRLQERRPVVLPRDAIKVQFIVNDTDIRTASLNEKCANLIAVAAGLRVESNRISHHPSKRALVWLGVAGDPYRGHHLHRDDKRLDQRAWHCGLKYYHHSYWQ